MRKSHRIHLCALYTSQKTTVEPSMVKMVTFRRTNTQHFINKMVKHKSLLRLLFTHTLFYIHVNIGLKWISSMTMVKCSMYMCALVTRLALCSLDNLIMRK